MGVRKACGVGDKASSAWEPGEGQPLSPKESFVVNVLKHSDPVAILEALSRSVKSGMFTEEELTGILLSSAFPDDGCADEYYKDESEDDRKKRLSAESAERLRAGAVLLNGIAEGKFHAGSRTERRLFDAFRMGELDNIPSAMVAIAGFKIPAEELAEALVLSCVLNSSRPMAMRERAMKIIYDGLVSGRFKSVAFDMSKWPPHLVEAFGKTASEEISLDRVMLEAFNRGMIDAIPSTVAVISKLNISDEEFVEAIDSRLMSLLGNMKSYQRMASLSRSPSEKNRWDDKSQVAKKLFQNLEKVWMRDRRDPDHSISAGLMDRWIEGESEYVRASAARIAPMLMGEKAFAWLKGALADENVIAVRCEILTAMALLMATGELSGDEAREFTGLALANIRKYPVLARDLIALLRNLKISNHPHKDVIVDFLVRMMGDADTQMWARVAAAEVLASYPDTVKGTFGFLMETIRTTEDRYAYENCLKIVSRMGRLERGEFVDLLSALENKAYYPSTIENREHPRSVSARQMFGEPPKPISSEETAQMLEPLHPEGRALLYSALRVQTDPPIRAKSDELLALLNEMDDAELSSLGDNAMDILLSGSIGAAEMPIIEKLARSGNAGVRRLAIQALRRMRLDKMSDAEKSDILDSGHAIVKEGLRDKDRPVRSAAVLAFTKFGSDSDIPMLIDILKNDTSAAMRGAAITALARLYGDRAPDPEFMAMLEEAVRDGSGMMEYLKDPDGENSGFSCTPAFCGIGITLFATMLLYEKGSEEQRNLAVGLMRELFDNPQMRRIGGGVLTANLRDLKKFVLRELLISGRQEDRALIAEFLAKVEDGGKLAADVLCDAYSLDKWQAESLLASHPDVLMGIGLDEIKSIAKSRPWIVKILNPEQLRDRKTAMTFVVTNGLTLEYLPEFQGDEWIVRSAMNQNGMAYKFAADSVKGDESIVRLALDRDYRAYDYFPADLKKKPEIRDRAIAKAKEVAMETEGRRPFDPFTAAMARDPEFVLPVIADCPRAIKNVSMVLRNNPEFLAFAMIANFNVIPHIDKIPQDVLWSRFVDMMKRNGIDFGVEFGSSYAEFTANMILRNIAVLKYKDIRDLHRDFQARKAAKKVIAEPINVEGQAAAEGQ